MLNCIEAHARKAQAGALTELQCHTSMFEREAEIYGEGDPAAHIWEVVSGAVRSLKIMADGRRQIVEFHFRGDLLGLAFSELHPLTAEAICETQVLKIARSKFDHARSENRELAQRVEGAVACAVERAQQHSVLLGRMTATERVAAFLLEMDRRIGTDDGVIVVPMSRRDIADYLGLTLETVSRIIAHFIRQRIVTASGRKIMLHRRDRLADALEGDSPAIALKISASPPADRPWRILPLRTALPGTAALGS